MAKILAANVTCQKIRRFVLPNQDEELAERGQTRWYQYTGKITVATGTEYDATTEIPLTNLFDSTHASYIGLDNNTCVSVGTSYYAGANFNFPVIFDWVNKKLRLLALPATPAEDEGFDEMTDNITVGVGTIEFTVIGKKP